MITIVKGDLLESKEKYIAHQTNCVVRRPKGLAKSLFSKYPYADVYTGRTKKDVPGTISIMGDGIDERYVINMFGQINVGRLKTNGNDTRQKREQYFQQCLDKILEIDNLTSIALPFQIGCGLARGNWSRYYKMLEDFSKKTNAQVFIYQLD